MATAKNVTAIPASLARFTAAPLAEKKKRRTAAYARVSTDSDEQFTSYEAQIDYYTNYIQSRSDWEFVEVYTDEGITGTSTKHREGFKRMIADALAGHIDLIVTKSVSRFARNTVDSLTTIRDLKEHGVECFFEKENIWTFDSKGELLITIMSSLAQEESRSISENCTWGQRKRFADGKVTVPFSHFLGYDRGEDGNLVVNPEQANTVKRIYAMFLKGTTPYGIAQALTADGIPTPGGRTQWSATVVKSILSNEKYKGCALLQKSFCEDFLTKKFKVNEGELPQYYVEGNHEAIIDPETFETVQTELARRSSGANRHSGVHILSGKIKCGQCGGVYGSKLWHSNDAYKRTVWQCNQKYKNNPHCTTPYLDEQTIKARFLKAANQLITKRKTVIDAYREAVDTVFDTSEQEEYAKQLLVEMEVISTQIQKFIRQNATTVLKQDEYGKEYEELAGKFEQIQNEHRAITEEISDKKQRRGTIESFLKALRRQKELLTEFSEDIWCALLDYATIYPDGKMTFTFKNGVSYNG